MWYSNPLGLINPAEIYLMAPYLFDALIYLLIFLGLTNAILRKDGVYGNKAGKPVAIGVGIALTVAMLVWEYQMGWMIGSIRLALLPITIIAIVLTVLFFESLKLLGLENKCAGALSFILVYAGVNALFEPFGASLNAWPLVGAFLALLVIIAVIVLFMCIGKLFQSDPDEIDNKIKAHEKEVEYRDKKEADRKRKKKERREERRPEFKIRSPRNGQTVGSTFEVWADEEKDAPLKKPTFYLLLPDKAEHIRAKRVKKGRLRALFRDIPPGQGYRLMLMDDALGTEQERSEVVINVKPDPEEETEEPEDSNGSAEEPSGDDKGKAEPEPQGSGIDHQTEADFSRTDRSSPMHDADRRIDDLRDELGNLFLIIAEQFKEANARQDELSEQVSRQLKQQAEQTQDQLEKLASIIGGTHGSVPEELQERLDALEKNQEALRAHTMAELKKQADKGDKRQQELLEALAKKKTPPRRKASKITLPARLIIKPSPPQGVKVNGSKAVIPDQLTNRTPVLFDVYREGGSRGDRVQLGLAVWLQRKGQKGRYLKQDELRSLDVSVEVKFKGRKRATRRSLKDRILGRARKKQGYANDQVIVMDPVTTALERDLREIRVYVGDIENPRPIFEAYDCDDGSHITFVLGGRLTDKDGKPKKLKGRMTLPRAHFTMYYQKGSTNASKRDDNWTPVREL